MISVIVKVCGGTAHTDTSKLRAVLTSLPLTNNMVCSHSAMHRYYFYYAHSQSQVDSTVVMASTARDSAQGWMWMHVLTSHADFIHKIMSHLKNPQVTPK